MIKLKNQEQIELLRQGGKILAQVLDSVKKQIKPGVDTLELDQTRRTPDKRLWRQVQLQGL